VLLGGLVFFVWFLSWGDAGDALFGLFIGLLVGFVVSMLVGAIFFSGTHWTEPREVKLVSLADGSGLSGSFFLGSGTFNERQVYTWYEETAHNSFEQSQADAEDATIHYTDDTPHYVVREKVYDNDDGMNLWALTLGGSRPLDAEYDFYVPKGSITNHYELDAK
jgi:hypothetical protein